MSVFTSIKNFFVGVGKAIDAALVKVFGSETAKKIEDTAISVAKTQLGKIATAVVLELATSNLDSAAKRAAAFDRIKSAAITAGIDAKDTYINYAIETAVLALKAGISELG